jgi:hypothetical protein
MSSANGNDRTLPTGASVNGAMIGGVVGLFVYEASFGIALANPRYIDWLLYGHDVTVHFLGWHMYRAEPWTFPLGRTLSFQYPFGSSIGLTDSIPLLAIPFKLLSPILGGDFQYIGLWLLLSYVLQGVFGALLVSTASSRVLLQVLGGALFVLAPPLLIRFGHAALSAHWLLLASLWVYFSPVTAHTPKRTLRAWVMLVGIASATHPYLAVMVLGLCAASYARSVIARPAAWLSSGAAPLAIVVLVSGVVLWQAGYFIGETARDVSAGLGHFSMNLLAPLIPNNRAAVFGLGPFSYAMPGQYEGYAYLGAGVMFLSVAAAVRYVLTVRRRPTRRLSLEHLPLVVVCICFIVFAVSPRVTAGTRTLFEYPATVWGPLAVFRASGRFVWPAYYAAITALVATSVRRFGSWSAVAVLGAAVLLQAADLKDWYRGARSLRAVRWQSPLFSTSFWSEAPRHYKHITLLPSNMCEPTGRAVDYVPFALVAGRAGTTLNGGFQARQNLDRFTHYCRSFDARRTRGEVSDDELYVMSRDFINGFQTRAQEPVTCLEVDGYGVCMTSRSYAVWQGRYGAAPSDRQ